MAFGVFNDKPALVTVTTGGRAINADRLSGIAHQLVILTGGATLGIVAEDGGDIRSMKGTWAVPAEALRDACPLTPGHIGVYATVEVGNPNSPPPAAQGIRF